MSSRSHQRFALLVATILSVVLAGSPPARAAERGRWIVRGRVLDDSGAPIRGAWVFAKGSRRAASLADTSGAYVLTVPGATDIEMSRAPVRIRLQARCGGWRIARANGATELGIEMRVVEDSTGAAQLLVRSNDPVIAALVANAVVLEESPQMILQVDFSGVRGVQEEVEAIDLPATQRVSLFGARAAAEAGAQGPASATPPMATPSPAVGESSDRARSRERDAVAEAAERIEQADRGPMVAEPAPPASPPPSVTQAQAAAPRVEKAPPPTPATSAVAGRELPRTPGEVGGADSPPAPAASGEVKQPAARPPATQGGVGSVGPPEPSELQDPPCRCQVRGSVEIESQRPLNESLPVVIFLEDAPAARDTVELFMGSPRAFDLGVPATCGVHRLSFEVHSKQRYRLASLEPLVDCAGGGTRSIKLVLAPAGRGSPFR